MPRSRPINSTRARRRLVVKFSGRRRRPLQGQDGFEPGGNGLRGRRFTQVAEVPLRAIGRTADRAPEGLVIFFRKRSVRHAFDIDDGLANVRAAPATPTRESRRKPLAPRPAIGRIGADSGS